MCNLRHARVLSLAHLLQRILARDIHVVIDARVNLADFAFCKLACLNMDPVIYQQIVSYKCHGKYPDGLCKNEKNSFRKKANLFEIEVGLIMKATLIVCNIFDDG